MLNYLQAFLQMSLHIRLQCNLEFMFCLVEIGAKLIWKGF